ncbi:MAG: AraC family transcriptional regulator [Solobacterium sp.]|nr:AraC family transcriptional regulator [Solobacterium sp.]
MKKELRSEFNKRQNMIEDSYEVYYYSDRHFQSVLPHTHDYYEFYFPAEGRIEMEIAGSRTPLSYRDVVIVPPRTVHRAVTESSEGSYSRYIFWISRRFYNELIKDIPEIGYVMKAAEEGTYIFHFSEAEYMALHSRLLRLIEENRADQYAKNAFARLCISDLLLSLSRMVYEHDHPEIKNERDDLFRSIMEYIEHHLEEDLSLDSIASSFFVSKGHIAHIFKDEIGISLHKYILRKRLERCAAAIASGKLIQDVYDNFGFKDYSAFFRAFKKEYGISPKEYQNVYTRDPRRPKNF